MNKKTEERMLELKSAHALMSLTEEERVELDRLCQKNPEIAADDSFEIAAAALQLASVDEEEMPAFLKNRISEQADDYWRASFGRAEKFADTRTAQKESSGASFVQWLGWAVAGVACIVLVVNIWFTGFGPNQLAGGGGADDKPTVDEKVPTLEEERAQLLASAATVRTEWTSPQADLNVGGEVVWNDQKQQGYMTFRGLPVNDKSKETYQLWIFDETQDEATPIDGGVFDVSEIGEAIIPIDASLRVSSPKAFAVTVEKPGGVVVSKREKVVALAKV